MTTESNSAAPSSDYAGGGNGGMTADEVAYFESGGETALNLEADKPGGDVVTNDNDNNGSKPDGGDKSAEPGKGGEHKHVPLAALQEERTKRKALGDTVKSLETQLAEFRGKFSIIERLNAKPGEAAAAEKPAGPPDVNEDIFGNVKHVGDTVAQIQKRLDDAEAATKATSDHNAFVNNYRGDAAQFETTTPDYREAYTFLLGTRAKELIAIGYDDPNTVAAGGGTAEEVHAARKALHDALTADEMAIAELAFSKKKSPAQIMYALATQRGYAKKAAPDGGKQPSKGEEALDVIERGQQSSKSLSSTGGGNGEDAMTGERLIAMPADEFEKWCEKHPAAAKRIMGG